MYPWAATSGTMAVARRMKDCILSDCLVVCNDTVKWEREISKNLDVWCNGQKVHTVQNESIANE